ncbi:MAG TPA: hypothetical protein VLA23_01995 [Candidatus Limnocylindrales bacterium]|nr:hypothetical protein [Candidatus Limnocylindrales bacterium]
MIAVPAATPVRTASLEDPPIPRSARLTVPLLALALALAAVVAGCAGATATPPPPSRGPDLEPCPPTGGTCVGPLVPGDHVSRSFVPQFAYDVPSGWRNDTDLPGNYYLRPVGFDVGGIYFFRDMAIASQDPTCPRIAATGIGTSAKEIVDWIAAAPGLQASRPESVDLGGLDAWRVEVALAADWTFACPFADGIPSHPLFVAESGIYWAMADTEQLQLTIADLPEGGTVAVDIDAFFGADYQALRQAADPIVRSIEFR